MWTRRSRAAGNAARSDADRIAEIAVESGEPVGEVLREVADFRLALETDLLIAAAAAEVGEAELVAEVVDGERAELVSFQDRLLERLADAAAADHARANVRAHDPSRALGRTRLVAAAAALLAVVGGGYATQQAATTPITPANIALAEADQELTILAGMTALSASADQVQRAAEDLHETIEGLIAEHGHDPRYAAQIAELIEKEQNLLESSSPPGSHEVLSEVNRLVARLAKKVPPAVRKSLPPLAPAPPPSKKASTAPSPSPSQSKSPSASPSSSPSASQSSNSSGDSNLPPAPAPPP